MATCVACQGEREWSRHGFLCRSCEHYADPATMRIYEAIMAKVARHQGHMASRARKGKTVYPLDPETRSAMFIAFRAAKEAAMKNAGVL